MSNKQKTYTKKQWIASAVCSFILIPFFIAVAVLIYPFFEKKPLLVTVPTVISVLLCILTGVCCILVAKQAPDTKPQEQKPKKEQLSTEEYVRSGIVFSIIGAAVALGGVAFLIPMLKRIFDKLAQPNWILVFPIVFILVGAALFFAGIKETRKGEATDENRKKLIKKYIIIIAAFSVIGAVGLTVLINGLTSGSTGGGTFVCSVCHRDFDGNPANMRSISNSGMCVQCHKNYEWANS